MLNAIRRAVLTQSKTANSQISLASEIEATRKARIAQSDYLFLRVTPAGYDWGKENDPDRLLPNVFYRKRVLNQVIFSIFPVWGNPTLNYAINRGL